MFNKIDTESKRLNTYICSECDYTITTKKKFTSCSNCRAIDRKITYTKPELLNRWSAMRSRCKHNKQGLTVCDEWRDYKVFEAWAYNNGYKKELHLTRDKELRIYSPETCAWLAPLGKA